ncbi:hypothetical protein [Vagococcus sp. WN89Y]|uniref:hypothetical protein n=1 Tax=Vagococcus sp. WN89Y TaxID=3457258 RepID=UPI003FCE2219
MLTKRRFIISYHLHASRCDLRQAKAINSLLNPAGSGDTACKPCAFFNEPRAAFYTDNQVKMQNKKALFAALPGKFSVIICDRMWHVSKNAGFGVKK